MSVNPYSLSRGFCVEAGAESRLSPVWKGWLRQLFRIIPDHTGYPETNNVTENNKRYCNQKAVIGSKHLSWTNLPRINLIRGKLFQDRYLHPTTPLISTAFVVVSRIGCIGVTGVRMRN